ncbi:MAG: outer membrane beta-barrel protein [Prolixibacteraceae bacterium]
MIKKNSVVSASYRRRITRSDYQDLNLSESRESELSAWKSNPFLKPNYIDNCQVSYSFKRMFVILNNYSVTHDFFCDYIRDFAEKEKCFNPAKPEKSYQ